MNTPPLVAVVSLLVLCLADLCPAQDPAGTVAAKPVAVDASKFPSLQAALDALPEAGGVVNLPPGTVELTEPLIVRTGETRIQGAGASTHLVNRNEDGKPVLLIKPANLEKDPKARLWRVQVNDLRISGNPKSGDGIYAEKVQEIFLHGVSIDHNGGNGIYLHDCFEDPRIADCIITYNAAAGVKLVNCHDIVVNANHFEENQDALFCGDSFNLCMNGNNIDDHLRHGVIIENTYGSVLSGNMIEECNGTAIILDRDCYGITLSANVIAHHLGGGIDLKDAWGCAISANTFTIAHQFSVRVGKESGRLTISANNFCNTHIGGKDKRPAESKTPMGIDEGTGLVLEDTADIAITGNNFGGLSTAAVRTEGKCQRLIISGNIVTDCGRKLAKDQPLIGTAENSIIKDNIVAPAR
jgi:parallel beta-helix repeat protein